MTAAARSTGEGPVPELVALVRALARIDALPEGLSAVPAENGKHILAHSETGHVCGSVAA